MQIRGTARASALAVAIAAAGFTLSPPLALAAASQATPIEQQLAAYRRDRTELERSIEQAEAAITRARAAGDTRALNAAIAQRGRLRAEMRALDATVRIVAGIAKDGAAATATYDGTLQALQGRVSDSATALRLAKDELAAANAGRSELSVAEATQALQLAARQYRNARITATSFAANSAEIEAVATVARTSSRAAAAPRKSGTDGGSGSGSTTTTGKGRKSTGTTTETTTSSATLLVTPTSTTTQSTTGSTELQTSTVESDSVFATLAAIAESGSTTTTATTEPVQEPAILEEPAPLIDPEPAPAPEPDTAPTTVEADPQTLLVENADGTAEPTGTIALPGDPVETDTTLADAEIDALLAAPEPAPATEEPAPQPEALVDATEPAPTSAPEAEPSDAELDAMIAGEPAPTETPTATEPAPDPVSEPLTQPVVDEPVVATTEPAPAAVSEPEPEPTPQPQPVIATGTATLSWSVPVTRANGAPLAMSELRGYELYVMAESTGESQVITIDDPLAASYTVSQLAPDTYHFAIAAVDSEQRLSELSEVVSKTIADTSVASAP